MNDEYSDDSFPLTFYFNGELMPKWGACWGLAQISSFLQVPGNLGHQAVWDVYCTIDHARQVESADPEVFTYAVQEVLYILLSQRDAVFSALAEQSYGQPQEIYSGLVEAALRMRELAIKQHCAFWTSGSESDRGRLVGTLRRRQIASTPTGDSFPPNLWVTYEELRSRREEQVRLVHQLAERGQCDESLRRRLHKGVS